jgi:SAM-dependent methyltransferase
MPAAKTRPYYAPGSLSAAWYDVVTAADRRLGGDVDVYAGLAPADGSVLELGAGSGRITQALAERGLSVTGVDIAPAMLEKAAARRAGLPSDVAERLEFRRGDMTALDLKRTFDLVICPYFTLAHVPAGAAWKNTFAVAARHLSPGGRAAFHLPSLEAMRSQGAPAPDRPVLSEPLPDGRTLLLFIRERTFRPDINRLDQVINYAIADASGRIVERSPERLTYWMTDPTPFAVGAGLEPDGEPIDVGGVGDIWVFRKP